MLSFCQSCRQAGIAKARSDGIADLLKGTINTRAPNPVGLLADYLASTD